VIWVATLERRMRIGQTAGPEDPRRHRGTCRTSIHSRFGGSGTDPSLVSGEGSWDGSESPDWLAERMTR